MSWFNPKSWFSKSAAKSQPVMEPVERGEYIDVPGRDEIRRFDMADTDRLNKSMWRFAHGQSINVDLHESLIPLQARCEWEKIHNAIVSGAIETLAVDIWGHEGPTLRVLSERKRFNDFVEGAWYDAFEMPDPNERFSGVETGYTWIRNLCTSGSFVNLFAQTDRDGPAKFGWSGIHCRRMNTPANIAGLPDIAFGQKLTIGGKTIEYYFAKHSRLGVGLFDSTDYDTVPARLVQHRYVAHEPEQLTGFPWLTSCLDTVANLRQYDHFVMQAAKLAANSAQSLQTSNPELAVDPQDLTGVILDWEPTSVNIAPKGWAWVSHQSTQPSTQYTQFRHERLRELGLALGMPLMMVLLSSADSNFASAHYDGAVYMRRVKALQTWLSLRALKGLLGQIITELRMGGLGVPTDYHLAWSWPIPPYVNPEKQRKADRIDLEDGTTSVPRLIAERGGDPEVVMEERAAYAEDATKHNLPPGPDFRAAAQLLQAEAAARDQKVDDTEDTPRNRINDRHLVTT